MAERIEETEVTDEALLQRIAAERDDLALDALYRRYVRLIYSIARGLVGDPGIAEEVTLDVFIQVWQKADRYDSERGQVNTWLTSLARYRAIDRLRRRSVRPAGHSVGWDELGRAPEVANSSPERHTARRMRQERVRQALLKLPPEQQQALSLAYFSGLTQQEIAEETETPLGTVKTRIRLAMEKLRFLLREERPSP